jgi:hypothetical protein
MAPMSEREPRRPMRASLAAVGLVVLLATATFIRPGDQGGAVLLANPDRSRVTELRAAFAQLPDAPIVLIGLDADLGTYAEIRTAVRVALDDLLGRQALLAFVSFTPEGRAIASAELDRLRRAGVREDSLLDLGFIAGAEAGMVRAVTDLRATDQASTAAGRLNDAGGGMAAFALALVIGGGELGPRTWVEQVGTRLPSLPIVAIAPTFALPELAPYLRTGQLTALLATLRDGAAYAATANSRTPPVATDAWQQRAPSALAMLLGMVLALVVLGRTLAFGLWGRPGGSGEGPMADAAGGGAPSEGKAPDAPTSGALAEGESSDENGPAADEGPATSVGDGDGAKVADDADATDAAEPGGSAS